MSAQPKREARKPGVVVKGPRVVTRRIMEHRPKTSEEEAIASASAPANDSFSMFIVYSEKEFFGSLRMSSVYTHISSLLKNPAKLELNAAKTLLEDDKFHWEVLFARLLNENIPMYVSPKHCVMFAGSGLKRFNDLGPKFHAKREEVFKKNSDMFSKSSIEVASCIEITKTMSLLDFEFVMRVTHSLFAKFAYNKLRDSVISETPVSLIPHNSFLSAAVVPESVKGPGSMAISGSYKTPYDLVKSVQNIIKANDAVRKTGTGSLRQIVFEGAMSKPGEGIRTFSVSVHAAAPAPVPTTVAKETKRHPYRVTIAQVLNAFNSTQIQQQLFEEFNEQINRKVTEDKSLVSVPTFGAVVDHIYFGKFKLYNGEESAIHPAAVVVINKGETRVSNYKLSTFASTALYFFCRKFGADKTAKLLLETLVKAGIDTSQITNLDALYTSKSTSRKVEDAEAFKPYSQEELHRHSMMSAAAAAAARRAQSPGARGPSPTRHVSSRADSAKKADADLGRRPSPTKTETRATRRPVDDDDDFFARPVTEGAASAKPPSSTTSAAKPREKSPAANFEGF